MYCSNCGSEFRSNDQKFCQNCGKEIKHIEKTKKEIIKKEMSSSNKKMLNCLLLVMFLIGGLAVILSIAALIIDKRMDLVTLLILIGGLITIFFPIMSARKDYLIKKNTKTIESNKEWSYSNFGARAGAFIIDYTIAILVGGFVLGIIIGLTSRNFNIEFGSLTDRLISILSLILFSIICLGLIKNTPGKALYGLRIVDHETHNKITWKQVITRSFGYFISSLIFGLGFWTAGFNKERRTWHDDWARTIVLQKRTNLIYLGIIVSIIALVSLIVLLAGQ